MHIKNKTDAQINAMLVNAQKSARFFSRKFMQFFNGRKALKNMAHPNNPLIISHLHTGNLNNASSTVHYHFAFGNLNNCITEGDIRLVFEELWVGAAKQSNKKLWLQQAASSQSVIEGKDINSDILQFVLKKNKIQSEVMPSKAIKTGKGLEHEVWIRLDNEEKLVRISGKVIIKDESFDDQLTEIIEKQAEKESIVQLKLVRDAGPQHFLAFHSLPFENGIPIRLFIKYLQKFAVDLAGVYAFDKDSILKKKT